MAPPLHNAAHQGDVKRLKLLLSSDGINIEQRSAEDTPLFFAVRIGKIEAARILLDHGADINATDETLDYYTPLYHAALHGTCDVMRLLIK